MPVLDPKFFQGCDPILPDILTKLFVGEPTHVNEINAAQLGWDGKLAGDIVLQLLEDGSLVRRGAFTLLGQLADQPVIIPAFKIWDKASKDLTATITLLKAEDFSFLDGGLCPDYIDEDEVQFAITKGHATILPPQYRQHRITGLSLCMLAHLARGSNGGGCLAIKLTLLGFPLSVEELRQEGEATQSAAWAGKQNALFFQWRP
jgi:hypothetical protein